MLTNRKVRRALLPHLPSQGRGKIYELGSGWGGIAFLLAKRYPNCTVEAYELSFIPYLFSKIVHLFYSCPNLHIYRKNFFSELFSDATLIYCYLYSGAMIKLEEKFKEELQEGTIVVSNTFTIPGWSPYLTITTNDLYHSKIYFFGFAKAEIANPAKDHPIIKSKISMPT